MNVKGDELRKLQALWYRKLKESGFEDLEIVAPNGNLYDLLKGGSSFNKHRIKAANDYEYYRAAGMFLWDHAWTSNRHREIWMMHCEGVCQREIAIALKSTRKSIEWTILRYKRLLKEAVNGKCTNKAISQNRRKRRRRPRSDGANRPGSGDRCRQANQSDPQRDRPRSEEVNPEIEHHDLGSSGIETFGILFTGYSRGR